MISHGHRFIFVHINKTGGTSIEKVFIDSADAMDVKFKHRRIHFYQRRFPEEFRDYFKFTIVRNPWDWLVSRYFWSKEKQRLFQFGFSEFVLRIAENKELSPEAPWLKEALRPQSSRIYIDDQLAVDFVGRFESLQTDFNSICDRIGVERLELPHVFKTTHDHYAHYYTEETREMVRDIYAPDLINFGYSFENDPVDA